jgi:uncharacterized membrane protein YraQ (UPF0718 family)
MAPIPHFIHMLGHYSVEIFPALIVGFLISGVVHQFVPEELVTRYLGKKGVLPILASTLVGAILPVCCWGSLPIAVSFHKKGARLGPILAFLVATPATSISAFLVALSVLGIKFAVYIFFAVIVMGVGIGLIGNLIPYTMPEKKREEEKPCCCCSGAEEHAGKTHGVKAKIQGALTYAFIDLPREIGKELIIGLILAAAISAFVPVGNLIRLYLGGWFGYLFSVIVGVFMYLCSTASVPLVDSLIRQGMNPGAGMVLLLIGPVTSYGTMLVLRKEYGGRVLALFMTSLIAFSLILGVVYAAIR